MPTTFPSNQATDLLLFRYFATLTDPRYRRAQRHPLMNILFIVLCATICGADTFAEMERWAKVKREWLAERLDLSSGIPTHDTLGRVFARLSPHAFSECFEAWTKALHQRTQGEVIALDGKTVRGSLDEATDSGALHLISAFAASNRLVLCQAVVEGHENEISAVPGLLSLLDVQDCVVTGDAMFCQKEIAAQIVEAKGDYVLALKENHPHLHDSVQDFFTYWREQDWKTEEEGDPIAHQFAQTIGKGHGRIEVRRCYLVPVTEVAAYLPTSPEEEGGWSGLRSVAAVESQRQERGKTTTHTRYFLTSLQEEKAAAQVLRASREHWSIENRLHWCLDVVLKEDAHQLRGRSNARAAVRNMALLRKIVLNLLRKGGDPTASLKGKRSLAGWDDKHLEAVLAGKTIQPTER